MSSCNHQKLWLWQAAQIWLVRFQERSGQHQEWLQDFQWQQWHDLQQKFRPGFQIYDVDAIIFPFVDVLFHLEVKRGSQLQEI